MGEAQARQALQPMMDDVENELNNAKQKLEQLKNSTGEAAEEIKNGAHLAVKALQVAYDKAADKFKN